MWRGHRIRRGHRIWRAHRVSRGHRIRARLRATGPGLGVVGVVVVGTLAACGGTGGPAPTGPLTSTAPAVAPSTPPAPASPPGDAAVADPHDLSAAEDPTALLLRVDVVGGLCADGRECRSAVVVDRRGGWTHVASDEGTTTGRLSAARLDDVVAVSDPVAARALVAGAPTPAGCARDHDGSELVVVVHPGDPDEVTLSTCEQEISGSDLLRVVAELLEEVSPAG